MPVVAVWMRDNDLGENPCHYLDPAARLPGAEAFVHIATGFTAFERGDRGEAQRSVDRALAVRPDLTRKIIRQAFRFPKWLALAVGYDAGNGPSRRIGPRATPPQPGCATRCPSPISASRSRSGPAPNGCTGLGTSPESLAWLARRWAGSGTGTASIRRRV